MSGRTPPSNSPNPSRCLSHTKSPAVQQSPFTTASFSTPIAAPTQFQHFNKTVSPPRHVSPYATTPQQQQQQHQQHHAFQNHHQQSLPDSSQSMAAPVSLPSHTATPPKPQPQAQATKPMATTPASPEQQQRERDQVTLLLDINRELLQEVLRLQEQGKGGMMSSQPTPGQDGNKEGDAAKKVASKEYIE